MTEDEHHEGGCACGAVRFIATGAPKRMGLCHCLTCRKRHGSAFNPFVVYRTDRVEITGALNAWRSSEHGVRLGCAVCGSAICMVEDGLDEIELNSGSFDETGLFTPQYENWIGHREPWLTPIGHQNSGNRP